MNELEPAVAAGARRRRLVALGVAVALVVAVVAVSVAISRNGAADGDRSLVLQAADGIAPVTSVPPSTDPGAVGGPGTSAPDGAAMVTVYAATGQLPRGAHGEDVVANGLVGPIQIEARFAPSTAVTTTDALRLKVAVFDIAPDTILVEGMFVDPSPVGTPELPAPVRTPGGEQRMP